MRILLSDDSKEVKVASYSCRNSEELKITVNTPTDPNSCKSTSALPNYGPTQLSVLLSVDTSGCSSTIDNEIPLAAIIGAIVGGAVLVAAIIAIAVVIAKRRALKKSQKSLHQSIHNASL